MAFGFGGGFGGGFGTLPVGMAFCLAPALTADGVGVPDAFAAAAPGLNGVADDDDAEPGCVSGPLPHLAVVGASLLGAAGNC